MNELFSLDVKPLSSDRAALRGPSDGPIGSHHERDSASALKTLLVARALIVSAPKGTPG